MLSTYYHRITAAFFCYGALPLPVLFAEDRSVDAIESTSELLPLSWEELTELDVSTLARKEQTVKDTPARGVCDYTRGYPSLGRHQLA